MGNAMELLSEPLREDMGPQVLAHLSQGGQLPPRGLLAGQCVFTALLALWATPALRAAGAHQVPVKDLDVFHDIGDRLLEHGFVGPRKIALAQAETYDAVLWRTLRIASVDKRDRLELIQVSGHRPGATAQEKADALLRQFDFNCLEVGVDLETKRLHWTSGFQRLVQGQEPVRAGFVPFAERTWMRFQRKRDQMPWLRWDEANIRSAVHLSQALHYLATIDRHQPDNALHKLSRSPAVADLHRLYGQKALTPSWVWPAHDTTEFAVAEVRHRCEAQLTLQPRDQVHLNAVVDELSRPNTIYLALNFADLQDALGQLIRHRNAAGLAAYVSSGGTWEDGASKDKPAQGGRRLDLFTLAATWSLDIAKSMLDAGWSPNERPSALEPTPYAVALRTVGRNAARNPEELAGRRLIQQMREQGGSLRLPYSGKTLWHWLKDNAPSPACELALELEPDLCELLVIQGGAPPAGRLDERYLPEARLPAMRERFARVDELVQACQSGDVGQARKALQAGALPDVGLSCAPLTVAASRGDVRMIDLLLEAGATVDFREDSGRTPLMVAAGRHPHAVARLLKAGADANAMDNGGASVLESAATDCLPLLLSHGARPDVPASMSSGAVSGSRLVEHMCSIDSPERARLFLEAIQPSCTAPGFENLLTVCEGWCEERSATRAVLDAFRARLAIEQILQAGPSLQALLAPS